MAKRKKGSKRKKRTTRQPQTNKNYGLINTLLTRGLVSGGGGFISQPPSSNAEALVNLERQRNELSKDLVNKLEPVNFELAQIKKNSNDALANSLKKSAGLEQAFKDFTREVNTQGRLMQQQLEFSRPSSIYTEPTSSNTKRPIIGGIRLTKAEEDQIKQQRKEKRKKKQEAEVPPPDDGEVQPPEN